MKKIKTNAMRALEALKIPYAVFSYDGSDGLIDGISVANKIKQPISLVYKTLLTLGQSGQVYVMVIPVAGELDLKKAARAVGEKSVHMLPVKDITLVSGYIRGGCSPLAMKKRYKTVIDESAMALKEMIVSAGQIGLQMMLTPEHLIVACSGCTAEIVIHDGTDSV